MRSAWGSRQRAGLATLGVAAVACLALVSGAAAKTTLCSPGSGAGQCQSPSGVAVDSESERVYVADTANNRIDVFGPVAGEFRFLFAFGWGVADGTTAALQTCTTTCFKGLEGSGAGEFKEPVSIAVDNNASSPAHHDVYVGTDNHRVQKFKEDGTFVEAISAASGECELKGREDPIAIGPGGTLEVLESRNKEPGVFETTVKKWDASVEPALCKPQVALSATHHGEALAVDSSGNIYVTFSFPDRGVSKYGPGGGPLLARLDADLETTSLAVDASGDVFAGQREENARSLRMITEYSPGLGGRLRRFAYGEQNLRSSGLAPLHTASGDAFSSEENGGVDYLANIPPSGPLVPAASVEASGVTNTRSTLKAEVTPEGKATHYHFEYLPQASFEAGGWASGDRKSSPSTEVPGSGGSEEERFKLHKAEALIGCPSPKTEASEGKCLTPETEYRFRVVAENADGEGNTPLEGGTFTTERALEIEDLWASEVGTDTASLTALLNPLGIPATGFFEYVTDSQFKQDVEQLGPGHGFDHAAESPAVDEGAAPIDFGSGEGGTRRSVTLALAPGTAYHFRLKATDTVLEEATRPPFESVERVFATFRSPSPFRCPANEAFRSGAAALLPDCRAYEMVSPLDKENGDIVALKGGGVILPAVLNQAATSGNRFAYGTYRAFGDAPSAPYTSQYVASRGEGGWESHAITPPRGRLVVQPASTLDTEVRALSPDLCEAWIRNLSDPPQTGGLPGYVNLYRRADEECGGPAYEALSMEAGALVEPPFAKVGSLTTLTLQGATPDGRAAIYSASDNLAADAPGQTAQCVSTAGELGCTRRLYYREAGGAPRYACVLPGGAPYEGDCSAGAAATTEEDFGEARSASLQGAISQDGREVFWTASGAGAGKIYLRENSGAPEEGCGEAGKSCTLAVSQKGEELSGTSASLFWGAAADGSKAIFTTGSDLYEYDVPSGETHLIAHKCLGLLGISKDASWVYLASEEALGGANGQGKSGQAAKRNLYAFHAGTFHFVAALAAADFGQNFAAVTQEARFRAAFVSEGGEAATFMSQASPTGYENTDAASGEEDAEAFVYDAGADGGLGKVSCASCNPSGARPAGRFVKEGVLNKRWLAGRLPLWESSLYAPHPLSDNGRRLFFESTDALVPRDTNGQMDVYEWEAPGEGTCREEGADYSAQDEGCIDLVSSGQSARESRLMDASPDGHDVFFSTLASLLPFDYGLIDVYDARAGGGLPSPPPPPAGCEGEACQHPAPAPSEPTLGSSIYEGPGNLEEKPKAKKPCPKGKARRKGRCVRKHSRHQRQKKGGGGK